MFQSIISAVEKIIQAEIVKVLPQIEQLLQSKIIPAVETAVETKVAAALLAHGLTPMVTAVAALSTPTDPAVPPKV